MFSSASQDMSAANTSSHQQAGQGMGTWAHISPQRCPFLFSGTRHVTREEEGVGSGGSGSGSISRLALRTYTSYGTNSGSGPEAYIPSIITPEVCVCFLITLGEIAFWSREGAGVETYRDRKNG